MKGVETGHAGRSHGPDGPTTVGVAYARRRASGRGLTQSGDTHIIQEDEKWWMRVGLFRCMPVMNVSVMEDWEEGGKEGG